MLVRVLAAPHGAAALAKQPIFCAAADASHTWTTRPQLLFDVQTKVCDAACPQADVDIIKVFQEVFPRDVEHAIVIAALRSHLRTYQGVGHPFRRVVTPRALPLERAPRVADLEQLPKRLEYYHVSPRNVHEAHRDDNEFEHH